jgi:nicotinate-nucleotide pyrophosphorylase (carboxylating)
MEPADFEDFIQRAFQEDHVFDDITTLGCIDPSAQAAATLLLKQEGILAGLKYIPAIFHQRDPTLSVRLFVSDGAHCPANTPLGRITGSAHSILSAERVALNLLQHLSGIATLTAKCVEKVRGTQCQILDTRKTLPGYRDLQKYATRCGGGINHRLHLADRILIKNNHLALVPLKTCLEKIKRRFPNSPIEVEINSSAQLLEALEAHSILLDNMSPAEVRQCVALNRGRAYLEASGGITLANLADYAATGVNGISLGALTHSAPALDISLRLKPLPLIMDDNFLQTRTP